MSKRNVASRSGQFAFAITLSHNQTPSLSQCRGDEQSKAGAAGLAERTHEPGAYAHVVPKVDNNDTGAYTVDCNQRDSLHLRGVSALSHFLQHHGPQIGQRYRKGREPVVRRGSVVANRPKSSQNDLKVAVLERHGGQNTAGPLAALAMWPSDKGSICYRNVLCCSYHIILCDFATPWSTYLGPNEWPADHLRPRSAPRYSETELTIRKERDVTLDCS
jgi:hypothetical protein